MATHSAFQSTLNFLTVAYRIVFIVHDWKAAVITEKQ